MFEALETRRLMATFTVTNLNDAGVGSLRKALADAEALVATADIIDFAPSLSGTITLTTGQLVINSDVEIRGGGASRLTVSANAATRVLQINAGFQATINGLAFTRGSAPLGGVIHTSGNVTLTGVVVSVGNGTDKGGGIYNAGQLRLENVRVTDSSADNYGGGIYSTGGLTLTDSLIQNNVTKVGGGIFVTSGVTVLMTRSQVIGNQAAAGAGGGICVDVVALIINQSVFSGNTASTFGGGIIAGGQSQIGTTTFDGNTATKGGGLYLPSGLHTIDGSTINGNTATSGDGGGIENATNLTVTASTISNNSSQLRGGGIHSATGALQVSGSTISGNTAPSGGGIFTSGPMSLANSTISGNTATGDSAGLCNEDDTTISNSTISGNSSPAGAAIVNFGTMNVRDTTISGNTTSAGQPAVWGFAGVMTLSNCTVAGNLVGTGIDVGNLKINLISTIVSGHTGSDVVGTLSADAQFNLIEDNAAAGITNGVGGNILGVNPLLGPLADNGGPTRTMALLAGSPAISKGKPAASATTDQRGTGFDRPHGSQVDIGAIEFLGRPVVTSVTPSAATLTRGTPLTFTATATDEDGGVTEVKFYQDLNGNGLLNAGEPMLISDSTSGDGYTFTFASTAGLPAGAYYVVAVAYDADSQSSESLGTSAVITNVLPTLTLLTPSAGSIAQGDALALTATGAADADGGLASVKFYSDVNNDGVADAGELLGTDSTSGDGYALALTTEQSNALSTGTAHFLAVAVDADGGTSTAAAASASVVFSIRAGTGRLVAGAADNTDAHRVLTLNPNGHLIVFEEGWTAVDLQAKTGAAAATGDGVIYVDPKDNLVYVAAPSAAGLLLFTRASDGSWSVRNLLAETGAMAMPSTLLTQFTSVGGIVVIAGLTGTGAIVGFQQTLATAAGGGPAFKFIDISGDLTSQGMTTPSFTSLISYVPSWDAWHLSGIDTNGKIQSVWVAPATFTTWRTDDLSAITGAPAIAGQLAVTLTSWGGINLSGLNSAGSLLTTWWVPEFAGNWQVNDLTAQFSGSPLSGGRVSAYTTPWGGLNYVGLAADGAVMVYWWVPGLTTWNVSPLLPESIPAEQRPTGTLTSSSSAAGTLSVYGTSASGDALRLWWKPSGAASWALDDLSAVAVRA